jgi:hypothetical protein
MSLSELRSKFNNSTVFTANRSGINPEYEGSSETCYFFPRELRDPNSSYPCVSFSFASPIDQKTQYIYLPMPGSLAVSDGASFDEIDLGMLAGAGGQDALQKVMKGDIKGAVSSLVGVGSQGTSLSMMEIASIAAQRMKSLEKYKKNIAFASKKIQPANKNTNFTGNNMRSFSFEFKLVARDSKDSENIRNIHNLLRKYLYAGDDGGSPNLILDFPPVWLIKFWDTPGVENNFIPKIFSCYLENLTCTFNGESNAYRVDGAPVDVSLGMTFKETRVLVRSDITTLEGRTSNRGIDPKTGLAISTVPVTNSNT